MLPRPHGVEHTSTRRYGQIYVLFINWTLLGATIGLVLGFQRSTDLAAAYGIAVTTTMVITDVLVTVAMRQLFRWSLALVAFLTAIFFAVDLSYLAGNIVKVAEGGRFPLGVGIGIFVVMATWRRGRPLLGPRIREGVMSLDDFKQRIADERLELGDATCVLGRETVLATDRPGTAIWREKLFAFLSRTALRATAYFQLPPEQVPEIGAQIDI